MHLFFGHLWGLNYILHFPPLCLPSFLPPTALILPLFLFISQCLGPQGQFSLPVLPLFTSCTLACPHLSFPGFNLSPLGHFRLYFLSVSSNPHVFLTFHNYTEISGHRAILTIRIFFQDILSLSPRLSLFLPCWTPSPTPFPAPTILICFFTQFAHPLPSPHCTHTYMHTHFSQLCRLVRVEGLESLADGHICLLSNLLLCLKEHTHTLSPCTHKHARTPTKIHTHTHT